MRLALVAIVFAVIVGVVTFTIWRLHISEAQQELNLFRDRQLEDVKTNLARAVRDRAEVWGRVARGLAADQAVRTLLARRGHEPGAGRERGRPGDALHDAKLNLANEARIGSDIRRVVLADARGRVLVQVGPAVAGAFGQGDDPDVELGWSVEQLPVFRKALGLIADRAYIGDVEVPRRPVALPGAAASSAPPPARPIVQVGAPVYLGSNATPDGVVLLDVDAERVLSAFDELARSEERLLLLLDASGRYLYHRDPERRLWGTAGTGAPSTLRDDYPEYAAHVLSGEESTQYREGDLVVAYAPVDVPGMETPWVAAALTPYEKVTESIRKRERKTFLFAGLIVVVILLAAVYMGRIVVAEVKSRQQAIYYRDMSEEKERSKRYLDSLFDAITDSIVVQDTSYGLVQANRVARERYGEGMVGKRCFEVYRGKPDRTGACRRECPVDRTIALGRPMVVEMTDPRTDEVHLVSTFPLFDEHGKVQQVIEHAKNITEQKKLEAQLIQTEKLSTLGEMAAGVAHEINNPVGVISMYAQLLSEEIEERLGTESGEMAKVRTIERQAEQAARIVRGLLDFSRKSSHEKRPVPVPRLVDGAMGVVGHQNIFDRVTVHRDFPEGLPPVLADEGQIVQVLVNLLRNAAQAMPNGGDLFVSARHVAHAPGVSSTDGFRPASPAPPKPADGGYGSVVVRVRDTGTGIPRKNLARIFDPFFTTKKAGQGTGLGLSVSFGIVRDHAGAISVESEEGKGATFIIELPAAEAGTSSASAPPTVQSTSTGRTTG